MSQQQQNPITAATTSVDRSRGASLYPPLGLNHQDLALPLFRENERLTSAILRHTSGIEHAPPDFNHESILSQTFAQQKSALEKFMNSCSESIFDVDTEIVLTGKQVLKRIYDSKSAAGAALQNLISLKKLPGIIETLLLFGNVILSYLVMFRRDLQFFIIDRRESGDQDFMATQFHRMPRDCIGSPPSAFLDPNSTLFREMSTKSEFFYVHVLIQAMWEKNTRCIEEMSFFKLESIVEMTFSSLRRWSDGSNKRESVPDFVMEFVISALDANEMPLEHVIDEYCKGVRELHEDVMGMRGAFWWNRLMRFTEGLVQETAFFANAPDGHASIYEKIEHVYAKSAFAAAEPAAAEPASADPASSVAAEAEAAAAAAAVTEERLSIYKRNRRPLQESCALRRQTRAGLKLQARQMRSSSSSSNQKKRMFIYRSNRPY